MCKHAAEVTTYREAQEQLKKVPSLAITVELHDALERSLKDQLADL